MDVNVLSLIFGNAYMKNIIIYAGDEHILSYVRFFKDLDFDLLIEDNQYNDIQCVDLSEVSSIVDNY